ncbi:site-specific integrase [Pseudaquabacterium pictum]|uniref:Integrase n=1 Tax=Pseudaquabacterium pictum TaxID=2315236 RepID=A0A480ALL5_9BURK|nr:site-specific integrase [Rubrivivax pictus]GCL61630.1 integrase [Rubrivivax pictus]
MDGLSRRPSGIYVARLTVPLRLRALVGQTELIASTGARDLPLARIVAGELLAQWRRRFLDLDRLQTPMDIDILRVATGSPALTSGTGYLPLAEAATASGIGEDSLLRDAARGRLQLFARLLRCRGMRVPFDALDRNPEGGWDVPQPDRMPEAAVEENLTGILQVLDSEEAAAHLLAGGSFCAVLFGIPNDPQRGFAPDQALALGRKSIELVAREVESLRRGHAMLVTQEQIDLASVDRTRQATSARSHDHRPLKESIEPFLSDHSRPRGDEQTRRIRDACTLFLALMGTELRGCDLSRDLMRRYRDDLLPTLPANENKVRLIHKTSSVTESIAAVAGTDWPRMSADQQLKRIGWLAGWLEWLGREGWAEPSLIEGIAGGGHAGRQATERRRSRKEQDKRDPFTAEELERIFSASWFRDGHGALTANGTYRTWMPANTWMPLIGLYTGARLGEIAQLNLEDIWQNDHGIWLFDIIDGSDEDENGAPGKKRLKNVNARRQIPVHRELVRIGLIDWTERLREAGYTRLFPELKYDKVKGYGKSFTKAFSRYLSGLGMPRNGRKVFHSFRHNMTNKLLNELDAPTVLAKQVLGHERGDSTTVNTYRKDVTADGADSKLVRLIDSVNYNFLGSVVAFDISAGLKAVKDALDRKNRGLGAEED